MSIDRRTLLKLLAAAALAGCGHREPDATGLRVVVAGAGIIGASIAYHLARSGAAVTVIDKLGPATHASRGTFAWINATWAKQPRHYHRLNQDSVAAWRELAQSLELPVRWGGSLEWFDSPERQQRLAEQIAEQADWGEPARMLNASEIAELEPNLVFAADQRAAFSPNDGAVDPVLATHRLLEAAREHGATVRFPLELEGVSMTRGRLTGVETTAGRIAADRLVLATGAAPGPPEFAAGIDIPQRSTPGVIALTQPMDRLLSRVVAVPGVHLHQRSDGRIVLGEQDGAPDNEAHALRLAGRPNDFPSEIIARQHGDRMLAVARQFVPQLADATIDTAYIGWRPLPLDGHPVLGPSPARNDIYLAITHSGVTLAPIVGQLVAHELAKGSAIERLAPYRPSRGFEHVKRY